MRESPVVVEGRARLTLSTDSGAITCLSEGMPLAHPAQQISFIVEQRSGIFAQAGPRPSREWRGRDSRLLGGLEKF
jgi:hypothetical protein